MECFRKLFADLGRTVSARDRNRMKGRIDKLLGMVRKRIGSIRTELLSLIAESLKLKSGNVGRKSLGSDRIKVSSGNRSPLNILV